MVSPVYNSANSHALWWIKRQHLALHATTWKWFGHGVMRVLFPYWCLICQQCNEPYSLKYLSCVAETTKFQFRSSKARCYSAKPIHRQIKTWVCLGINQTWHDLLFIWTLYCLLLSGTVCFVCLHLYVHFVSASGDTPKGHPPFVDCLMQQTKLLVCQFGKFLSNWTILRNFLALLLMSMFWTC